jgi:hypothetical protein
MDQSPPWEAACLLATQTILRLLWNQNFNFCADKSTQLDIILGQMNPFHILTPRFFTIHFKFILPSDYTC